MNLSTLFSASLLALLLLVHAPAQETREPILVDEFGILGCDDLLGRLDAYLYELRKVPTSKGLVVIRNSPHLRHKSVFKQEMIEAHFRWRKWEQAPLEYARADHDGDELVQLWRIPSGSEPPPIERLLPSFAMHKSVTDPFMLAYDSDLGSICPEVDSEKIFAGFLRDNPSARANIVVRDRSQKNALRRAGRIRDTFEKSFGVDRRRIRVFIRKPIYPVHINPPKAEYWYLP